MQAFPHHYTVTAAAEESTHVFLTSDSLQPLASEPPAQFDGPGELWSPETLFVGAVADCFVLTFRSISRASKLAWTRITCKGHGILDRVDGLTRFTAIDLDVTVTAAAGMDPDRVRIALEKTKKACLIGNSLRCEVTLHPHVTVEEPQRIAS